jgi:hypothetical protein
MLTKKKTAILALALIALVATVSAGAYFIISNYIHREVSVKRVNGINIIVSDFPSDIEIGKNYTFTVETQNVLDHGLEDLVTYIVIAFIDTEGNRVELKPSMFWIYYQDPQWEGYIQNTFQWDSTRQALVSTALGGGSWDAPVGYDNLATVTFSIDPQCTLGNGTLILDIWVESPSFP